MAKMILSRRTVLRGALVGGGLATMPLPRLDAMLNGNGNAYAQGGAIRKIYGTWFWGNGVAPNQWTPSGVGADFPLSPQLMPFAPFKKNLTVVSGMTCKTGRFGAHLYHAGALTGSVGGANKSADMPSIDQLIANKIGTDTPFKSLELGVSTASPKASSQLYTNVSWRAANAPNPADFNPHSVFMRLFGAGSPGANAGSKPAGGGAPAAPPDTSLPTVRKSVLDAVSQDARELSGRLGSEDRKRLDKHLEGIRALEKRLEGGGGGGGGGTVAGCQKGADSTYPPDSKAEAAPELNKIMADLLVAALSCDLTRVFTFIFTYPAAHVYFRNLGQNKDFHAQICHGEGGDQPSFNAGVIYTMQSWAYLLGEMDKIKEGDGTLLDNSLVYGSSCVAWGKNHAFVNWPVMLLGRAGGALKGNMHVAAPDDNLSKVILTIGNVFGLGLKEIGKGGGLVNAEVPGIRA